MANLPPLTEGKRVRAINRQASICPCGFELLDVPIGTEYTAWLWTLRLATFQCGSCELAQDIHVLMVQREGTEPNYLPLACFFEEIPRG